MKFGFSAPTFGDFDERELARLASKAEVAGWDGFFIWDHILWDPFGSGIADTTVTLAAIALATERIRLGALVTPLARRRPWKFAREIASLDRVSRGRVIVGVGGGDDVDFTPVGDASSSRTRAQLLDEGLEVVAALWRGEQVEHEGTHFHVTDVRMRPTPVQRPRPPIWVGGWWPNRHPFARGARWDGIVPLNRDSPGQPLSPDGVRDCVRFVRSLRGDRPLEVVVTGFGTDPEPYEEAGATWWLAGIDPWSETIADAERRIQHGPPR